MELMNTYDRVVENFIRFVEIIKQFDNENTPLFALYNAMSGMCSLYSEYKKIIAYAYDYDGLSYYQEDLEEILKKQDTIFNYLSP